MSPLSSLARYAAIAFRIAEEALKNVRRHAEAKTVEVTLVSSAGGTRVVVRDDGRGFDLEGSGPNGSVGLAAMRERASMASGWLRVESAPGRGTTVEFWIPNG